MGCCGEQRAALKGLSPPPAPAPRAAPPQHGPVWLQCTQRAPMRVLGAVTGAAYEFSPARPTALVDPGDAAVLLRTGSFRLAS